MRKILAHNSSNTKFHVRGILWTITKFHYILEEIKFLRIPQILKQNRNKLLLVGAGNIHGHYHIDITGVPYWFQYSRAIPPI